MRPGRLSANAADRSLNRPFAGLATDMPCRAESMVLLAGLPPTLLLDRLCNRFLAAGEEPLAAQVSLVWPETANEQELAALNALLAGEMKKRGLMVSSLHATVSGAVSAPVLTLGLAGKEAQAPRQAPMPGWQILAVGHAGLAGAAFLARRERESLLGRFTPGWLAAAEAFAGEISLRELGTWRRQTAQPVVCLPAEEGGVLAALWQFAEACRLGFSVELRGIPIRQETVEIAEFLGINPYELLSDGLCLIAAEDGQGVMRELAAHGLAARCIGSLQAGKKKVLRRGEEDRYLDKPAMDAWEIHR